MTREPLFSDIHFDIPDTPIDTKAMADATAQMLNDPTNQIIAVLPGKDGKPIYITR